MRTFPGIGILSVALAGIGACVASVPPPELVNARVAYDRASKGPAPATTPRDMDSAKKQLEVAESSFKNDGDTQATRDSAYLALRKAEYAEVIARTLLSDQATGATVDAMHADEKKTVASTAAALGRTKSELATQEAANSAQKWRTPTPK